jgi:hypothetical protein
MQNETTSDLPNRTPVQRFTDWYQEQGLILFLAFLPIVLLLWLIAVAKYMFIKVTKGIRRHDYIRTN